MSLELTFENLCLAESSFLSSSSAFNNSYRTNAQNRSCCWIDYTKQCNTLQHIATHCITLQHTILQHTTGKDVTHQTPWYLAAELTMSNTATHCNALQHTKYHDISLLNWLYQTLQHTETHCNTMTSRDWIDYIKHCNTLHHTASHCNRLQHTATHCNALWYLAAESTMSNEPIADLWSQLGRFNKVVRLLIIVIQVVNFFLLQYLTVCCRVACCSVLQCVAVFCNLTELSLWFKLSIFFCCSVLQCDAVCCNLTEFAVWFKLMKYFCCSVL